MKWLALILLLAGCQISARQAARQVDVAVAEEDAALLETPVDPALVADARVRAGVLAVARLRSADSGVYDPTFRILDDNGRLRLIVQDPITHRYKLVR